MTSEPRHEAVVDAEIARLMDAEARAEHAVLRAMNYVHRAAGDKHDRLAGWGMGIEEAVNVLGAEHPDVVEYRKAVAAHRDVSSLLMAEESKYTGWSRFFLVTNTNGHIHSGLRCSTCTPTTSFAWLTDVSGLSEAEAVAIHGERLRSVCFPSAPVEWVEGYERKSKAEAQAARDARAAAKAEKDAKRAAYWAERHYDIQRVSDGHVYHCYDARLRAEAHGLTLKAALREAKEMSAYGERYVAIDLLTGEQVGLDK